MVVDSYQNETADVQQGNLEWYSSCSQTKKMRQVTRERITMDMVVDSYQNETADVQQGNLEWYSSCSQQAGKGKCGRDAGVVVMCGWREGGEF